MADRVGLGLAFQLERRLGRPWPVASEVTGLAPLPAGTRVLAVAETYDAMTRSQVRAQISPEDALEYLKHGRGHMFDADCVDALRDALQPRRTCIPLSNVGY